MTLRAMVVGLALGASAAYGDQPAPLYTDACGSAVNIIYAAPLSASSDFPSCFLADPSFGYDHCEAVAPRWETDYNSGADNWWNYSSTQFGDTYDVHGAALLRVLVRHTGTARTVTFRGEWDEAAGGGRVHTHIYEVGTNRFINANTLTLEEGQCQDGHCVLEWESPAVNTVLPIAAGMQVERRKGPNLTDKSRDQWMYAVCQGPACQICQAPAFSWIPLGLFVIPVLLIGMRNLKRLLVALLVLVPLGAHAKGLPQISVWSVPGEKVARENPLVEMDAVPGIRVAKGQLNEDGACQLPEIRVSINRDTYSSADLLIDDTCNVTVDNVDTREPQPPPAQNEGSASGSGLICERQVWARTTLTFVTNIVTYPLFLDFWRLSRVYTSFQMDDDGNPPPLYCHNFDHFASSADHIGFVYSPNNLGIPDYMFDPNGTDPYLTDAISYPITDPIRLAVAKTGYCVQSQAMSFNFVGSAWLPDLKYLGFPHGLLASCAAGPAGYYNCVMAMSADSVIPNEHTKIWPSGNFRIPEIDFPFYTKVRAEGGADWWGCPLEWIKPPVPWQ